MANKGNGRGGYNGAHQQRGGGGGGRGAGGGSGGGRGGYNNAAVRCTSMLDYEAKYKAWKESEPSFVENDKDEEDDGE